MKREQPNINLNHSRIPELDGIRAIAIWMVLTLHIFYGWVPSDHDFSPIPAFFMLIIGHGWLGVDLFFVLSGFLITGILLDSKAKPHYYLNFYARRFLRIMPLYFVVVFAFWVCYVRYSGYFILSTLFMANLANLFNIRVPHGPGVLWSLPVEEHFYLLWPFVVSVLDRGKLVILTILIVVVTPIARGLAVVHGMPVEAAVYSYSWFRFDGLALGALIAIWVRSSYACTSNSYRLAAVLVSLAAAITIIGTPYGLNHKGVVGTALRFTQAQLPFAAFLLVAIMLTGSKLMAILRSPFARLSGNLSYCIYLIHLALGDGYEVMVRRFELRPDFIFGSLGAILLRGAFIILVSFGIAVVSKRYLEDPFLKLRRFFS